MARFLPKTKLIIKPEIKSKLSHKHGLTTNQAREFFELFEWEAFRLPPNPKNPQIAIPLYGIQKEWKQRRYLMVFGMLHPPGTEAFLITFYPIDADVIPTNTIKGYLRDVT